MAEYVYRAEDGDEESIHVSMHDAPAIGDVRVWRGKEFRRIPNTPVPCVSQNFHFESSSLPRGYPYAPDHNPENGKPRFTSQRQARECEAKAQDAGEPIIWDN